MSDDGFREAQELTRALRGELKEIRADVHAIVRNEVERAGIDEQRMRALVRSAVAAEMSARTPWLLARFRWVAPAAAALLGLALGLSAFALYAVRSADTAVEPTVAVAEPTATMPPAPQTVPADPAQRAARYDSLLAAHAPALAPLVERLASETASGPVLTAIDAWRRGAMSSDERDRLHAALVQSVLRAEVDPTLVIDGSILRDPCRGGSCNALLRLWQERGTEFGLPVWLGATTDGAAVRTAERLLVLERAEREG